MSPQPTGKPLIESVADSRAAKRAMIQKYGFMPMSVLEISRGTLSRQMFIMQQERPDRSGSVKKRMLQKQEKNVDRLALGVAGGVTTPKIGESTTIASTMPAELVDFFVKYYLPEPEGKVYLDPFMGQGIQMQIAIMRGMHYYGYDVSAEFFEYIDGVRNRIDPLHLASIWCADSATPDEIPDDHGDFSFHSPPYWDVEFYGT